MTEWLYGRHAVEEALVAGRRRVHRLLLADNTKGSNRNEPGTPRDLENVAREKQVGVEWVPSSRLDVVTRVGHHHQGVAAEVSPFVYSSLADIEALCREAGQSAIVLLLDQVQDPQNFGTLLRTAEAVGVTAVVMLDRRQVEVTPAVVNASSGAVEHLQVCLANNLPRAIESLQEAGLWVYALQAEPDAPVYTAVDLKGPLGLVVGSEGKGISRLVHERCDGALAIPMRGKVESLNAAVAGSLVLYEALRQRS
ncbi:MAG: 23S rRNA (guanosine(2251)-2'-O)-methyltransferase RlmB [Chloroflexia bacterium]